MTSDLFLKQVGHNGHTVIRLILYIPHHIDEDIITMNDSVQE